MAEGSEAISPGAPDAIAAARPAPPPWPWKDDNKLSDSVGAWRRMVVRVSGRDPRSWKDDEDEARAFWSGESVQGRTFRAAYIHAAACSGCDRCRAFRGLPWDPEEPWPPFEEGRGAFFRLFATGAVASRELPSAEVHLRAFLRVVERGSRGTEKPK